MQKNCKQKKHIAKTNKIQTNCKQKYKFVSKFIENIGQMSEYSVR